MRLLSSPFCTYCGEAADTDDHIVPHIYGGTVTVPACRACNSAVGAKQFDSLAQKIDYVHALANRAGRGHVFGFNIMCRHVAIATTRWNANENIESNARIAHICDICETPISHGKHYKFRPFVCSESCYLIRKKIRYAALGWRDHTWQPIGIPAKIAPKAETAHASAKPPKRTSARFW